MRSITYGHLTGAFLLLSIMSGFVVAYQYEVATPFVSAVAMDAVLPFGYFWRALHFWTSQAFVILLLAHVFDLLHKVEGAGATLRLKRHWSFVSICVPVGIYALFSGYVLRYDATGQAAGAIAEHLFLKIPFIGNAVDKFLMNLSGDGLNRLYGVHILAGFICWLLGTWYHLKRVNIPYKSFIVSLVAGVLFSFMVRAPMDLPFANAHLIKGPWFFLGIQELLRYFDPLVAGILMPAIPIGVLVIMPWVRNAKILYAIVLLWAFAYSGITLIALLRGG